MDASSIWSPSREPHELLDAADTVAVYALGTSTAIPLLPIVEEHFADATNPGARELLFRGLIRYLAPGVDDAVAREDYLAALERVGDDANTRLRITTRLVQLALWHKRHAEVLEWLEAAGSITGATEPHVRAERAYWRARFLEHSTHDAPAEAYRLAAAFAAEAGSMIRWFDCRIRAADCEISRQQPYRGPPLSELADAAIAAGMPRQDVVRRLLDLAAHLQVAGDPTAARAWIAELSAEDLQHTGARAEIGIGQLLVRVGREGEAIALHAHRASLPNAPAETRWLSQLLHLGLRAQRDTEVIPTFVEHASRWRESNAEPIYRLTASALLTDVAAFDTAAMLLHDIDTDPSVEPELRPSVRLNLAGALSSLGRLSEARAVFDTVPRDALKDDPEFEGLWFLAASLFARLEGLDEIAAEHSLRALEFFRQRGALQHLGIAATNAVTFESDPIRCERFIRELNETLPLLTGRVRAHACVALAEKLGERGELPTASDLLDDALRVARDLGDLRLAAATHIAFGWIAIDRNVDIARRAFLAARHIAPEGTDLHAIAHYGSAFTAISTPHAWRLMTRAARSLEACGRTWVAAVAWSIAADETPDVLRAIAFDRRGLRTMLRALAQCADPRLRALALERMRPVGASLVRRQLSVGDATSALETTYRLKSADAIRPTPGSTQIDPTLAVALRSAMEPRAIASSLISTALRGAPLSAEARESGRIAELLARNDPRIRDARIRAAAVQRRIGPREAAIEYLVLRDEQEFVRFTVTRDRIDVRRRRWTPEHDEAARVVGSVIAGRHHGGSGTVWTRMLRTLHDALLAPLASPRPARVWVAPGGYLANVPFHALLDRHGRPALERVDLRLLVSTAQLAFLPRRRRRPTRASVLRGDDTGFAPLLSADHEHARVASTLRTAGIALTEDAADLPASDVIHYAGHAHFDPGTGSTTLPLAGRRLSDEDLTCIALPRRPLLVLSACESGRGLSSVDTMTGMLRAAFAAGARDVIVSGWPAEDTSTAALMERFYRHLLRGEGPATALRVASREILAAGGPAAHPFFWANFRCYGPG